MKISLYLVRYYFLTFSGYCIPTLVFSGSNQVGPRVPDAQNIENQQEQKVTSNKINNRETTKTETAQLRASEVERDSSVGLKRVSGIPPASSKRKDIGYIDSKNVSKRQKQGTGDGIEGGQAGTLVSKMDRNLSMGDAGKCLIFL